MKTNKQKLGLVLAGGAAKGAYQSGALKYIAELGLVPDMIAGTSIGALNGAVLSSYQPFPDAVKRLNKFWYKIAQTKILRLNKSTIINRAVRPFLSELQTWMFDILIEQGIFPDCEAIFDPAPIDKLLREAVNANELRKGIELWATVFPSLEIPGLGYSFLINLVRARTGTDAHWLRVQDCIDNETIYNLLLASAALPLAFPSRNINEQTYVDGFLGDNIPLKALVNEGCTHAIVIHLDNGETWNRYDFPNQIIIEIRPEKLITKQGLPIVNLLDTAFDFTYERIKELEKRGYEDAQRCLNPIIEAFSIIKEQRQTEIKLIKSTEFLLNDLPLEKDDNE